MQNRRSSAGHTFHFILRADYLPRYIACSAGNLSALKASLPKLGCSASCVASSAASPLIFHRIVRSSIGGEVCSNELACGKAATPSNSHHSLPDQRWVIGETHDIGLDYELGEELGKGQFGTVRVAVSLTSGDKVACKSIPKRKLLLAADMEDVRREVQIMRHLAGHPNIIQLIAVYEDTLMVHLVMELACGGQLIDSILRQGCYQEQDAAKVFRSMAGVVAHCHSLGVMHRDLKAENFLLSGSGPGQAAQLKVADFGLSTFFKEGQRFHEMVGTAYYMAPEVLRRCYTQQADVWALGVMLHILLCGSPPFYGETDAAIFQEVLTGQLQLTTPAWQAVSQQAKDLVAALLVKEPHRRLTAQEAVDHPWLHQAVGAVASPALQHTLPRLQTFTTAIKVAKQAVQAVSGHLQRQDILRGLREQLSAMDADSSGTVTLHQLVGALRHESISLPEDAVQTLVAGMEGAGSGAVDYDSFVAACLQRHRLAKADLLLQACQRLDRDASGFLPKADLLAALDRFEAGASTGADDLKDLLHRVNKDEDDRVDYADFCALMLQDDARSMDGTSCSSRQLRRSLQVPLSSQAQFLLYGDSFSLPGPL